MLTKAAYEQRTSQCAYFQFLGVYTSSNCMVWERGDLITRLALGDTTTLYGSLNCMGESLVGMHIAVSRVDLYIPSGSQVWEGSLGSLGSLAWEVVGSVRPVWE